MDHQKEQMLRLGKNSHPIHKGWSLYGSVQSSPLNVSDLMVVEEPQRFDQRGMHLHYSAWTLGCQGGKWTRKSDHSLTTKAVVWRCGRIYLQGAFYAVTPDPQHDRGADDLLAMVLRTEWTTLLLLWGLTKKVWDWSYHSEPSVAILLWHIGIFFKFFWLLEFSSGRPRSSQRYSGSGLAAKQKKYPTLATTCARMNPPSISAKFFTGQN